MNAVTLDTTLRVNHTQVHDALVIAFRAKLVPMIWGSPALGKSTIVHNLANEYNLKVIDLRLSQCEPQDLLGFPKIEGNRAGYVPMDTFPIEGDSLPFKEMGVNKEGVAAPVTYNGWLLFLDELTSAIPAVQAAAYKIILDRMVGNYRLHKEVYIVGAGNLESDNAVVQPMSTALQSRLVHMELYLDPKCWYDWAIKKDIDHRIISFVQFKPDNLYTFSPDHTDKTYASPRTWEFTDRILKAVKSNVDDPNVYPLVSGTVSRGVAQEFLTFCELFGKIPTMAEIEADPQYARMPEEPHILYALSGSIGSILNEDNIAKLMPYIMRMKIEFQIVTLRYPIKKFPTMVTNNVSIQKWVSNNAHVLF